MLLPNNRPFCCFFLINGSLQLQKFTVSQPVYSGFTPNIHFMIQLMNLNHVSAHYHIRLYNVLPSNRQSRMPSVTFKVRLRWCGADLAKLLYFCHLSGDLNVLYIK